MRLCEINTSTQLSAILEVVTGRRRWEEHGDDINPIVGEALYALARQNGFSGDVENHKGQGKLVFLGDLHVVQTGHLCVVWRRGEVETLIH